jgi:molybdopterin-guanine dinucleotide biosynthesis protein A
MSHDPAKGVIGVLLAGGKSRRMGGGDKNLRQLGGETILSRVVRQARPQVETLILNANGDASRFEAYDLPIIPDVVGDHAGPLAGVLTGMAWARENKPSAPWVVTFPTDAPFFPDDLVDSLRQAVDMAGDDLACAGSMGRPHPVFGLWPVWLYDRLRHAVVEEGVRKIDEWTARYRIVEVDFPADPIDPFFNLNSPEDLETAEKLIARE